MRGRSLLMISFDNSRRFHRRTLYFSYEGVEFKLVQDNPRKHADHLMAIVENEEERLRAFRSAAEFMSALAWENDSCVAVWDSGYRSWPAPRTLRQATVFFRTFPRAPFMGVVIGYSISRLPHIENERQRRALALFREAGAANNDYLKFLLYWQVLEVVDPPGAITFVNNAFGRDRPALHIREEDLRQLPLNGRKLGNYLWDDCRNALAHLTRRPGELQIDIDDPGDRLRLALSTRVIEGFARHYIAKHLRLTKIKYLRQLAHGQVPVYLAADDHRGKYVDTAARPRARKQLER
jgi:hypothetical protein